MNDDMWEASMRWERSNAFSPDDVLNELKKHFGKDIKDICCECDEINFSGPKKKFQDIRSHMSSCFQAKFSILNEWILEMEIKDKSLVYQIQKYGNVSKYNCLNINHQTNYSCTVKGSFRSINRFLQDMKQSLFMEELNGLKNNADNCCDENLKLSYSNKLDKIHDSNYREKKYNHLVTLPSGLLNLFFICGDITQQPSDIIVNSTNSKLTFNSQISKAIALAAGAGVMKSCQEYLERYNSLPVSEVFLSNNTGRLPFKAIIHASCPNVRNGMLEKDCKHLLVQTFYNCIEYANANNAECLSLPLLGSGKAGISLDTVSYSAFKALKIFEEMIPKEKVQHLKSILFIDISKEKIDSFFEHIRFFLNGHSKPRIRSVTSTTAHSRGNKCARCGKNSKTVFQCNHLACEECAISHKQCNTCGMTFGMSALSPRYRSSASINTHRYQTTGGTSTQTACLGDNCAECGKTKQRLFHCGHPACSCCASKFEQCSKCRSTSISLAPMTSRFRSDTKRKVPSRRSTSVPNKKNCVDAGKSRVCQDDQDCTICLSKIENCKTLPCGHSFCTGCVLRWLETQNKCPLCNMCFGIGKGMQPINGTMKTVCKQYSLPGHEDCSTIEITYNFPSGTQESFHPSPGKLYKGITRTAYLPNNPDGIEVHKLLKTAFDARLIFTIGRSNTTGKDGVIIWNDIHHKTSINGSHGYPDPTYLQRVKSELAAQGIVPKSVPNSPRHLNSKETIL